MLCYDPARRITARQALAHPWFDSVRSAEEVRARSALLAAQRLRQEMQLRPSAPAGPGSSAAAAAAAELAPPDGASGSGSGGGPPTTPTATQGHLLSCEGGCWSWVLVPSCMRGLMWGRVIVMQHWRLPACHALLFAPCPCPLQAVPGQQRCHQHPSGAQSVRAAGPCGTWSGTSTLRCPTITALQSLPYLIMLTRARNPNAATPPSPMHVHLPTLPVCTSILCCTPHNSLLITP